MKKLIYVGTVLIFVCLATACGQDFAFPQFGNNSKATLNDMECYVTFEEFAYVLPESYSREPLLPTIPWEIESVVPSEFIEEFPYPRLGYEAMIARTVDGNPEVWLVRPSKASRENIKNILTYYPVSKEWEPVTDIVVGTNVFISEVFQTTDGTIWGVNDWDGITNPDQGPVLSKFNEQTQQFEFALGILEIPFTRDQQFINIDFVVDPSGRIWIFVQDDSIYSYEPNTETTSKHTDLESVFVNASVLSTDGSFYFIDQHYSKMVSGDPPFRIAREMIFRFDPDTGELTPLEIPDEPWPMAFSTFVTESDHLWLSAVGYIDLNDESWHLVNLKPSIYFDNVGQDAWASPKLMLESSNGLLWFNKYSGIYEGTAWYDPETGEGCMFTNLPVNIVEDDRQQLWMFADGKLYRYALE